MANDLVVLVHGTFARGAPWAAENGPLAQTLKSRISGAKVRSFPWTGDNNHMARLAAGRELAQFLDELNAQHPDATLHLITHSHGGNVALYAADQMRATDKLGSITFLGTPFLTATPRRIAPQAGRFAFLLSAPLAFFFIVAALLIAIPIVNSLSGLWQTIAILIVMGVIVSSIQAFSKWVKSGISSGLESSQKLHEAPFAHKPPQCRLYIATVPRDEAGLLLGTIDGIAAIPWRFLRFASRYGRTIGGAEFCAVTLMAFFTSQSNVNAYMAASVISMGVLAVLTASYFALQWQAPLISAALRGNAFAFGGEGPLFAITTRVVPETLPPFELPPGSKERTFEPVKTASEYRHCGFYENPECIDDVIAWIRGQSGADVSSSPQPAKQPRREERKWDKFALWLAWILLVLLLEAYCSWAGIVFKRN
ncbi:MAG: alpha/beta hydrolase [Rhizomicrobium sp.]|jgi:pimeloyl-ACP methyl ester carboxylesterase